MFMSVFFFIIGISFILGYFDTNVIAPEAVIKRHHAMILNGKYLHDELMSKTDEVPHNSLHLLLVFELLF